MFGKTFSNKSVNSLNAHYGLQTFATNLVNIFIGVYLYQLGIDIWIICLVWGGIYFFRLLTRPIGYFLCNKFGLKKVLVLGTLSYSIGYVILGQVDGVNLWLYLYVLAGALSEGIYWLAYHTYFAILGDTEVRGKQVGMREAVRNLAQFSAPIAGAVFINMFDFWIAFLLAMICMIFASVPLLIAPDVKLPQTMTLKKAVKTISFRGFKLYASDSFYFQSHMFIWKLILFIMLSDYITFGGLLSFAIAVQIIGYFLVGHLFDNGLGKRVFPFGIMIMMLVVGGRALAAYTIPMIIFLDLLYMIGYCLYEPVMNSLYYNECKKSKHPLWFQTFSDSGWDIGSSLAMIMAAILLYSGVDIRMTMLQGIVGLALLGMTIGSLIPVDKQLQLHRFRNKLKSYRHHIVYSLVSKVVKKLI